MLLGGNGNPLQCSCLQNPRDGGAWWAAVYGVAQSRTRLKRLSSRLSSSSRVLGDAQPSFSEKGETRELVRRKGKRDNPWGSPGCLDPRLHSHIGQLRGQPPQWHRGTEYPAGLVQPWPPAAPEFPTGVLNRSPQNSHESRTILDV